VKLMAGEQRNMNEGLRETGRQWTAPLAERL
jgi:hypothetical protein